MDSLAIEFAPGALNAIKVQVIRGCKPAPRGYTEVGGLLCGAIVEFPGSTVVRIDSIIPVMLEPPDGRASHLSNTDKWYLSKAIQDCASRPVIGWYRSQTQPDDATPESSGVILEEDRSSSAEFFPKRKTAFLICNPDKDFNLPGRLCIWSAGKAEVVTAVSLGPCAPVLNPVLNPDRSPRPARHSPQLKAMAATLSDAVARQWTAIAETLRAALAFLWRRSARILAFSIPPVIAIAAFMIAGRFRSATHESLRPRPTSLGMKAYRVGNEMFLNWNRSAAEILQAENGNLTIVDDGRKRNLKLSPKDLQTGSLTCQADGDDVRIELDVVGRAGDFVESLRVVGESPALMAATAPTDAHAAPQTAEIKPPIPDKPAKQEPIAPPRQPEARTVIVAAPEPKVITAPPPAKPKQLEKALVAAPKPIYKVAAAVTPPPEKTPTRQPVPSPITTARRETPKVSVQPPPPTRTASRSVVNVLSKPSQSRSAINQPVAIRKDLPRKDLPRLPVPEQRNQAEILPREKAEEYVKPRAIQSPQPSFDDSAKAAIDRVLSQSNEAHEVRVQVNIDDHGSVVRAAVASTTGPFASLFVDPALDAARRWQFKPANLDGRPVASSVTLRFAFVRKPH